MPMVTTTFDNTAVNILKNLRIFAAANFDLHPDEYPMIVGKPIPTDLQINKEMYYEGDGALPEQTENASATPSSFIEGYVETVAVKLYSYDMPISWHLRKFAVKNAQMLSQMGRFLARSAKLRYEYTAISILDNATSGSFLGGDGVAYASASHLFKSSATTFSNLLTAADLTKTQLESGLKSMVNATMENSIPASLRPKQLNFGYENVFKVPELLKSSLDPESANNTYNAFQEFPIGKNLNHYPADTDQWSIDSQIQTRLMYEAQKPTMDDYMDAPKKNMVASMHVSIGSGFVRPLGTFVNMGA